MRGCEVSRTLAEMLHAHLCSVWDAERDQFKQVRVAHELACSALYACRVCVPCMLVYACLTCMPYMYGKQVLAPRSCVHYMHALYICHRRLRHVCEQMSAFVCALPLTPMPCVCNETCGNQVLVPDELPGGLPPNVDFRFSHTLPCAAALLSPARSPSSSTTRPSSLSHCLSLRRSLPSSLPPPTILFLSRAFWPVIGRSSCLSVSLSRTRSHT